MPRRMEHAIDFLWPTAQDFLKLGLEDKEPLLAIDQNPPRSYGPRYIGRRASRRGDGHFFSGFRRNFIFHNRSDENCSTDYVARKGVAKWYFCRGFVARFFCDTSLFSLFPTSPRKRDLSAVISSEITVYQSIEDGIYKENENCTRRDLNPQPAASEAVTLSN